MAVAAILRNIGILLFSYLSSDFDKFGTQPKKSMLNSKNTKPEVSRHFPRWPSPPFRKMLEFWYSAIYHAIWLKIATQPKKVMLNLKNTKPEVGCHISRWPPPPFKKHRSFVTTLFIIRLRLNFVHNLRKLC
jgi:hypothetical protein